MVFDRALTLELLIWHCASQPMQRTGATAWAHLTLALRDHVSEQEANGKTKDCLSRVWISPPIPARQMIHWAVDHQDLDPERTVLHLGALLATFPFAGTVTSIIGRQLHLEGAVDPRQVRSEAAALLGDRSTVDVGARKVVTTLRHLGLLDGSEWRAAACGPPANRSLVISSLGNALLTPHAASQCRWYRRAFSCFRARYFETGGRWFLRLSAARSPYGGKPYHRDSATDVG